MLQKIKAGIKYIGAVIVAGGVAILALQPSDTIVIHPDRQNIQSFEIYKHQTIVRDFRVEDTDGGSQTFDTRFIIPMNDNPFGLQGDNHLNVFLKSGVVEKIEINGTLTTTTSEMMINIESILSDIVLGLNQ